MSKYKLFKKTSNYLKFLTPLQDNSKLKVAKVIAGNDRMYIGYNEDEEMFLEIAQCPRIYVGMELRCKNMDTNSYEDLGKLVDIQYREDSGFLFIFQMGKKHYRYCKYCDRIIPSGYDLNEHKQICKNIKF